jgi:hypothetical protein
VPNWNAVHSVSPFLASFLDRKNRFHLYCINDLGPTWRPMSDVTFWNLLHVLVESTYTTGELLRAEICYFGDIYIYNTWQICLWDMKLCLESCFWELALCNQTAVKSGRNPSEHEETNLSGEVRKRRTASRISSIYQTAKAIHRNGRVTQAEKQAQLSAVLNKLISICWNKIWRSYNSEN